MFCNVIMIAIFLCNSARIKCGSLMSYYPMPSLANEINWKPMMKSIVQTRTWQQTLTSKISLPKEQELAIKIWLAVQQCGSKVMSYTRNRNVLSWWFLAGNQDNHQNFDPSLLTNKLWLVFMRMRQKNNFFFEKKKLKWPT